MKSRAVWFNKTFSSIHSSLAQIRKGDQNRKYRLIVSGQNPNTVARLTADEFHLEPRGLHGADYVNWCLEFCLSHEIRVFVPGKESSLIAGESARFFANEVRVMNCADRLTLELIHNKSDFYQTMQADPVPPPNWIACSSYAEFEEAYCQLAASHDDVCFKPSVSVYGIGFRRIRTDKTAYQLLTGGYDYQIDLDSLRVLLREKGSFPTLLVMEYLPGHEYSVDCISDHGALKCAIQRRKPMHPGHGQIIDSCESIHDACCAIVKKFKLNGYSNIQFREGREGLRLLEVNPRMSGGVAMACLAGPNLPYLGLVGLDQGYENLQIPSVQFGIRVGEFNTATVL